MAIQFILGRSGTGKTRYCIESIVKGMRQWPGKPIILLLPEQATYQAERAILSSPGVSGFSDLHVLSFNRLGFKLAQLSGKNAGGTELSHLGCGMVVQKILAQCKEQLSVFAGSGDRDGLVKQLAATIQKFHECEITPGRLKEVSQKLAADPRSVLTSRKFADIALVFENYLRFFEDKSDGIANPDVRLTAVKEEIKKADFLKDAIVYVDGFASFTVQELSLLMEVLKLSSEAHIAICLDPTRIEFVNPDRKMLNPASIFSRTECTYVDLVDAARGCRIKVAAPILLNEARRFGSKSLGAIETGLFADEAVKKISAGASIKILAAPNPRAEVDAIAAGIIELVQTKGYRFRDIAVIASDLGQYQHYIEAAFADASIACFIDRPKAMSTHPAAELITAALKSVAGSISSSDVLAYLKTDLSPIERGQVDVLENYCLACGIGGRDWTAKEAWRFADKDSTFDQDEIDCLRRAAIKPLATLKDKLASGKEITAEDFTAAVFGLLDEVGVKKKLVNWSSENSDSQHQQFYNKLVDIFDEMVRVFGQSLASADEFASIVSAALSEMSLKLIPQTLDQVLVGSIERSRHPELKAVFLAGVTQKQFPLPIATDAILSDEDKSAAGDGLELGDGLMEQLSARQYLAYIAFTRPSEYLHISYPLADSEDKPELGSPFLDNLSGLFDDLKIESCRKQRGTVADRLCAGFGAESNGMGEHGMELSGMLIESDEPAEMQMGELLTYSLSYNNSAAIDRDVLVKNGAWFVKDNKLESSTTRLSSMAACPYKHFGEYILKLKRRDIMEFAPMDMGKFYHKVLDGVAKELLKRSLDFGSTETDGLEKISKQQIALLLEKDPTIGNFARQSAYNNYIITSAYDVVVDAVNAYAQIARAGGFKLAESEVRFGFDGSKAECKFLLEDGTEVILRGVIDRLDVCEIDGKLTGLVFDYKLTGRSISYSRLANKLDMQLPVYMLAVKNMKIGDRRIEDIAGGFYLPIQVPIEYGSGDSLENKKFEYKAKGIFNGAMSEQLNAGAKGWSEFYNFFVTKDGPFGHFRSSGAVNPEQFGNVLEFTEQSIQELSSAIVEGSIEITPYRIGKASPCSWCDMRSVCRFDWQINSYNVLTAMDKQDFLDGLEAGL